MAKRPSPSRVKTHRIYTPFEAADVLGVHRQTVLRWIKDHGLNADKSQKPWLIKGIDLKVFLGERRQSRRCKLQEHLFYCFKCKVPREAFGKMADYVQQTPTSGRLTALCPECGCLMNKMAKRADLDAIRAKIEVTIQQANPRLVSPEDTPSNVTFEQESRTNGKTQTG